MRIFVLAAGIAGLMLAFQNCGQVRESSLYTKSSKPFVFEEYFSYPYTDAPVVYGQVQLATSQAAKNFSDVQYIAVFGRADGANAAFNYQIDIVNESNYPVCPGKTGTATGGQTSVVESCLSQVQAKSVTIKLKVTTGGKSYDFQKTYEGI